MRNNQSVRFTQQRLYLFPINSRHIQKHADPSAFAGVTWNVIDDRILLYEHVRLARRADAINANATVAVVVVHVPSKPPATDFEAHVSENGFGFGVRKRFDDANDAAAGS